MRPIQRIFPIFGLLLSLTLFGTIGLRIIEGASWLDSFYMCIITLSTVGYEDAVDLSDTGKLFISFYLIVGLGVFTYSAFQLGQWVVSAQMRSVWERRRMGKAIDKLENHFIVCGCGRMGQTICHYLHERGKRFVVIDSNDELLKDVCDEHGWLYVWGDATDDEILTRAGIHQARSLASVLPTDADNVYVVLTSHMLHPELQIIARASDEKAVLKLERAGAGRVISPFSSGAVKMARFMLNPSIEDFFEIADTHGSELELADVQIADGSPYVGMKLMETDLRNKGVMIIGIRRANGERLMPPPGSATIHAGDCLFAFGSTEAVNEMIGEADRR